MATGHMAQGLHFPLAFKQEAHTHMGQPAKKRIHRPIKMPKLHSPF